MSGFDNGTSQGLVSIAKQFGSILRGFGPPVPEAGVVGDCYIDTQSWRFYAKRQVQGLDDWGHFLFVVPPLYRTSLKFFGTTAPDDSVGVPGDYYLLWAGFDNYGMQPVIWGPRQWTGWPENGDGPGTVVTNGANVLQIGIADEGPAVLDKAPSQLIQVGLLAEYVVPIPVTANDGDPVLQLGLQTSGQLVEVDLNPLYTAEDEHAV